MASTPVVLGLGSVLLQVVSASKVKNRQGIPDLGQIRQKPIDDTFDPENPRTNQHAELLAALEVLELLQFVGRWIGRG
ncbi:hypothetical protein VKT23_012683 [Stygiomarasmius scandens]|uniref:Secreted protein n=1 Tax=Marasmiellus scandens TaxID=2682957 RepID=A0ABR1J5K8_9AGAR